MIQPTTHAKKSSTKCPHSSHRGFFASHTALTATTVQHRNNRWGRTIIKDFVTLYFITAFTALSSPSAETKTSQHSNHKPKLWGVIPTINTYFREQERQPSQPPTMKHFIVCTQCQQIAEKYGIVHPSTGDMLRQAVSSKSMNNKEAMHLHQIKQCTETGNLIPRWNHDTSRIGSSQCTRWTTQDLVQICLYVPRWCCNQASCWSTNRSWDRKIVPFEL